MNGRELAAVDVYVSAGSNIDAPLHLREACTRLAARYPGLKVSPVYRSAPVGFSGDDFLNLVVGFRTADSAAQILGFLDSLHEQAGRQRDAPRLSPHTLDLDLLLYGDCISEHRPQLPHPDILHCAYVLAPLADLAPEARHPVDGRRYAELWAAFDPRSQPVRREAVNPG